MEFVDQVVLPHVRQAGKVHRKIKILVGVASLLAAYQGHSRGVTRLLSYLKARLTAAVAGYIEERGGLKLFTLEDGALPETHPH